MRHYDLDVENRDEMRAWLDLRSRVFLNDHATDDQLAELQQDIRGGGDRVQLVEDDGETVAAFRSFDTRVSIPGGARLGANAVTSITVSSTHRRRGLLSGWMVPELHRAAREGAVVSVLLASEATIYGRYGFGVVSGDTTWTVDVSRARFIRAPTGRVRALDLDRVQEVGSRFYPAAAARCVGTIERRNAGWRRVADTDRQRLWAMVHENDTGEPDGLVVYRYTGDMYDKRTLALEVVDLVAATREAEHALWQHCVGVDLIRAVTVSRTSVDLALPHWLTDPRAATTGEILDGLWLRVHDVPALLSARTYPVPGTLRLRVTDPLDQITGTYELVVADDGTGRCVRSEAAQVDTELSAAALAGLVFGLSPGGPNLAALLDNGSLCSRDPARLMATFGVTEPRWPLTHF